MPDNRYDWVTVREASRRLKCSTETIRRQAKAGELEHPWEWAPRSRSDRRLAMWVGFPKTASDATSAPHEATAAPDAVDPLRVAVDALRAQIAAQEARHASERLIDASRIDGLEREAVALDETARLLAADAVDASRRADQAERERDESRTETARLAGELARKAAPWWWPFG